MDDFKDGPGNTILFSESLQAQQWNHVHLTDNAAALQSGVNPANAKLMQGMVFWPVDSEGYGGAALPDPKMFINSDRYTARMGADGMAAVWARPSAAHNGGVNAGFADGQTRWVSESIDYRVYQAYLTLRGKSSDVPFSEFVPAGDPL